MEFVILSRTVCVCMFGNAFEYLGMLSGWIGNCGGLKKSEVIIVVKRSG